MLFRFRYCEAGGHTHIRFFAGKGEGSLGNAGSFVLRNEEFKLFRESFDCGTSFDGRVTVQFVEEDDTSKIDR